MIGFFRRHAALLIAVAVACRTDSARASPWRSRIQQVRAAGIGAAGRLRKRHHRRHRRRPTMAPPAPRRAASGHEGNGREPLWP